MTEIKDCHVDNSTSVPHLHARIRELEAALRSVIKEDDESHRNNWGRISYDARQVIEEVLGLPAAERKTMPTQSETGANDAT